MYRLLGAVGREILDRGDPSLGCTILLYANYMRAGINGEGEEYIDKYRELLTKFGLIDIIRLEREEAKKRRKFKHPQYNEENLFIS